MRIGMMVKWSLALAGALVLAQGCGDESVEGKDSDTPLFDGQGELPDVTQDDSSEGTDATADSSATTVTDADTSRPDLVPDEDPPEVVSTIPAAGAEGVALPLTVTITFDEPVFGNTVAPASVKLINWLGDEVPGAPVLSADGKTVTWTPTTQNLQLASAYTIRLVAGVQGISDLAGNRISTVFEAKFSTAAYPAQEKYAELAAKYAPTIHAPVNNGAQPQFNVPTKFDGDGDWNLQNNRQWITSGATQLIPAVYWSVTESRTHYFMHYGLYFPFVNHTNSESSHTNAMNGVLVVVEKAHGEVAERPLVAYTYWKEPNREEMLSFATVESNIAKDDQAPSSWGINAEFAQDDLFPDNRLQLHVTAGTHRTCLWGWDDGSALTPTCEFNAGVENGDVLSFAYLGNSPTPVVKGENGWPADMSDVDGQPDAFGYTLIPIYTSLWPRRFETGEGKIFEPTTFQYGPESGRPGAGLELTAKFLETLGANPAAFGNPIWAWKWQPTPCPADFMCGESSPGVPIIKKGQFAMDPAFYVWRRHKRSTATNGIVDYVPASNTGFSLDYCFNGYLAIDVRAASDSACPL